jgi:hypothetical protein
MGAVRFMLQLNSATCAGFGLWFAVSAPGIGAFLGGFPETLLRVVGVMLVLHSLHLLAASLRTTLQPWEIYYFSAGDMLWFLLSLLVLVATDFVTSPAGIRATLAVAIGVALIGLGQLWTHSEATRAGLPPPGTDRDDAQSDYLPSHLSRLGAIGLSWLSIKTWVKAWLLALNAVFLCALLFWPDPLARIVLAAYFATAPLLLGLLIVQRGLTRLLGVAHLIPWLPLLGYLAVRLASDAAGPQITVQPAPGLFYYTLVLLVLVGACIAFDILDIVRWLRGERARFGPG